MAWMAAPASASSATNDPWVVSLATRWRLLVDRVAKWSWAERHASSFPVSAVRTISGLSFRSVRAAACCIEVEPWRNSSM